MRLLKGVIAAAVFLTCFAAHAATISQTLSQTINYSGTGPIENFGGIALFNPDLGTLINVTQTLYGNVTFVPNSPSSSFSFGVNGPQAPINSLQTFYSSGTINVSATSSGPILEESTSQFGQQYVIEFFDVSINNGTLISNGPVTDTFTFNYIPTAVTPEPSSLVLLGTGLLGVATAIRRRAGLPKAARA